MSDIKIDLTGLIYLMTVALTAIALFAVAIVAAIVALLKHDGRRARRVAVAAMLMSGAPCVLLLATFATVDSYATRPDWIDYATIPWLALFAFACWRLTRI
jgi:phosphoglycerol transferase MdoB-like AlkP superfamily enzyme